VLKTYNQIWEGDMQKLSNLPVESFLPMLLLKHLGSFARDFEISPNFFEYGFDQEMVFD
jgi:hypothetical protein